VLDIFADLQPTVGGHACAASARMLFPDYPARLAPFLPAEWLEPVRAPH
jgi:hypothetical protein